jgi:hypothetical protein
MDEASDPTASELRELGVAWQNPLGFLKAQPTGKADQKTAVGCLDYANFKNVLLGPSIRTT